MEQSELEIYKNMEDPKEALKNPETCNIPTDNAELYAFCIHLVEHTEEDTMKNLLTIMDRIKLEYRLMMLMNINSHHKELKNTKAFIQYTSKLQELF